MRTKMKCIVIFFFLVTNYSYSQDKTHKMQQIDSNIEKAKSTKSDLHIKNKFVFNNEKNEVIINTKNVKNATFPIIYDFEFFLDDIYNLDLKNDYFFSKLFLATYLNYDSLVLRDNGKVYSTFPKNNFRLKYQLGDESYFSEWNYQGFVKDSLYNQYSYVSEVENNFIHVWDLRNYPFDKQKLKIEFISSRDTSEVILKPSENFPPSYNKSISDLKDGYNIVGISSEVSYYESPFDQISEGGVNRKKIFSKLTFNIEIDRAGSWLFIKLFIGTFLSFFISWIVFLIPLKEFESRIGLSVGAIFGAIGNRYFVDSTMPNVQILTKADLLNSLILILLVFNILIVVLQANKNINFPYLENNSNAMKISAISLIVLTTLILIF